jgi:hypothetical protein
MDWVSGPMVAMLAIGSLSGTGFAVPRFLLCG